MNCKFIEDHLDGICREELESAQLSESMIHIGDCTSCRKLIGEHQLYLKTMHQLESPDLAPASRASILRNAVPEDSGQQNAFYIIFQKDLSQPQ